MTALPFQGGLMPDHAIDVSGERIYAHTIGNKDCGEGWCGDRYPKPCDNDCPGLIHADFGDEDYDGFWLYTKCDVCGESE